MAIISLCSGFAFFLVLVSWICCLYLAVCNISVNLFQFFLRSRRNCTSESRSLKSSQLGLIVLVQTLLHPRRVSSYVIMDGSGQRSRDETTLNSKVPAKSRRNNPFLPSSPESTSPVNPVASEETRTNEDAQHMKFSSEKPTKPGLLSTLLNFGLNTTPRRDSESESYVEEKDPWKRDSMANTLMGGRDAPYFGLPLPTIPVPLVSMKTRRPSAIIRNVTGYSFYHNSFRTAKTF